MKYYYRAPPPSLKPYIGSYYLMDTPQAQAGQTRVEIPHLRFVCRGQLNVNIRFGSFVLPANSMWVFGPSFGVGDANCAENTKVIGCSLTPAGWHAFIGASAEEYADARLPFQQVRPDIDMADYCARLGEDRTDEDLFAETDAFLEAALITDPPPRWDFNAAAMEWASDPACPGIDVLIEKTGLSARQVDRLCRYYLGGSPKKVHRVFRALNIAHRLTVDGADNWRDVVGPFYDQSHFIRDFKDRIGCRPGDFHGEWLRMMRFDLALKNAVPGTPKYCLIG